MAGNPNERSDEATRPASMDPQARSSMSDGSPPPLSKQSSSLLSRAESFMQKDMPRGMSGLTGSGWAQIPTLTEVRQGIYTTEGEDRYRQFETSDTPDARRGATLGEIPSAFAEEKSDSHLDPQPSAGPSVTSRNMNLTKTPTVLDTDIQLTQSGTYPNGYKFPPKHTWKESTAIGFKAFLKFSFTTWVGALITFYAVQVVGWGGMIFILLCGGGDSRACWLQRDGRWVEDCSSKHTSKSLWIEIDAQVLTALFCVTAFGLIPWRFRDLWHLYQWRVQKNHIALRKLAGAHKGWFRLPNSHHLDPLVAATEVRGDPEAEKLVVFPLEKAPPPPWTGVRAFPTKLWRMDFVVWLMIMNTVFQIPLCGIMWGMNRFNRPSFATALLIVLGMLSGIFAGVVQFIGTKQIKAREGVPIPVAQLGPVKADKESGEHSESV